MISKNSLANELKVQYQNKKYYFLVVWSPSSYTSPEKWINKQLSHLFYVRPRRTREFKTMAYHSRKKTFALSSPLPNSTKTLHISLIHVLQSPLRAELNHLSVYHFHHRKLPALGFHWNNIPIWLITFSKKLIDKMFSNTKRLLTPSGHLTFCPKTKRLSKKMSFTCFQPLTITCRPQLRLYCHMTDA